MILQPFCVSQTSDAIWKKSRITFLSYCNFCGGSETQGWALSNVTKSIQYYWAQLWRIRSGARLWPWTQTVPQFDLKLDDLILQKHGLCKLFFMYNSSSLMRATTSSIIKSKQTPSIGKVVNAKPVWISRPFLIQLYCIFVDWFHLRLFFCHEKDVKKKAHSSYARLVRYILYLAITMLTEPN